MFMMELYWSRENFQHGGNVLFDVAFYFIVMNQIDVLLYT